MVLSPLPILTQSSESWKRQLLSLVLKRGAPFEQGLGQPRRAQDGPTCVLGPKSPDPYFSRDLENVISRRKLGVSLFNSILQKRKLIPIGKMPLSRSHGELQSQDQSLKVSG